jgi:hypothetical protein
MFIYRSSYMIYHVVCIKSNTTSATSGAGPAGTAGAPEFTPSCMSCSCSSIFRLMFYRSLFVICLFSVDHCVVCPSINSF